MESTVPNLRGQKLVCLIRCYKGYLEELMTALKAQLQYRERCHINIFLSTRKKRNQRSKTYLVPIRNRPS